MLVLKAARTKCRQSERELNVLFLRSPADVVGLIHIEITKFVV